MVAWLNTCDAGADRLDNSEAPWMIVGDSEPLAGSMELL